MKNFIKLILLLFFNLAYSSPEADYISKEAKILEKKYSLCRFGTGFFGPYKGYKFSYQFYREMTIEDARKLIVVFANDLQYRTNLFNFNKGFEGEKDGKKSLWINIHFVDRNQEHILKEGCINFASLAYGNIRYKLREENGRYNAVHEESFEEAAQIVAKSFLQNNIN